MSSTRKSKIHSNWQKELSESFTTPTELLHQLKLDTKITSEVSKATKMFPFKVTQSYASRMEKGNINDPLLRQVLPVDLELIEKPGYSDNPVGDKEAITTAGILQKYDERALLLTTGACAINCRYCFRRNFPYNETQLTRQQEQLAFDYLRDSPKIHEVILSGGDPLVLGDNRLQGILEKLSSLDHIKRVRIHTRLPIVLPSRVTFQLIRILTAIRPTPIVVVHTNHANEIDSDVQEAINRLRDARITVLNQSVLLKGINDDLPILSDLSESLFEVGILPYYLHLLDKTNGAAHFEVATEIALRLQEGLRRKLPGYLVPRFVQEYTGAQYKLPLQDSIPLALKNTHF
ncbi:MAG: EF-P beta-lysylation protein EpmB [Methylococcales bacterium]